MDDREEETEKRHGGPGIPGGEEWPGPVKYRAGGGCVRDAENRPVLPPSPESLLDGAVVRLQSVLMRLIKTAVADLETQLGSTALSRQV